MAIASSYDSTGRYGAQTTFSDQLDNRWMGGRWELDATHNSIIAVTNGGKAATKAILTFHYNGGKDSYKTSRAVAPGDQLWLNMGEIIHGAIADDQGSTFPPDLTGGSYELGQADDGTQPSLFEGKIIIDKTYGHLMYGCLNCCVQSAVQMLANPDYVYESDSMGIWAYDSCFQDREDISSQNGVWDTNNHSIATMNVRRITGVAVGIADPFANGYIIGQARDTCSQRNNQGQSTAKGDAHYYWNGNAIANTTQSAVTGQQIALTAAYSLPQGVTVASQSWTVAGTTVGGYTANNQTGMPMQTNFSGQSTTFYWVTAGNSLNVTFTLNLNGGNMPTATASASFNITGVTSAGMIVQTPNNGALTVNQLTGCQGISGGPYLVFGNIMGPAPGCGNNYTGTPGISFTPQGTQPGTGNFMFVQLINSDTTT